MNRRGSTLIELMAALAVTAILAIVAGRLLFDGMEMWRIQADREYAVRNATLALDKLAEDLASQPSRHGLPDPVTSFSLESSTREIAFYIPAENARTASVCWYLSGDGPWTLSRVKADADATESALSSSSTNAAGTIAAAILDGSDTTSASDSVVTCKNVLSLEYATPAGADAPQLMIKMLTPEGASRVSNGESTDNLPERCVFTQARPVK
jgi:prepilin-type N-terminal cleavage/methylation domain-containing protein